MPEAHLEYNADRAGEGTVRMWCSIEMAAYVVERLTSLAISLEGKNQTQLIIDRTFAVRAAPRRDGTRDLGARLADRLHASGRR